jgi:hypothetical protein
VRSGNGDAHPDRHPRHHRDAHAAADGYAGANGDRNVFGDANCDGCAQRDADRDGDADGLGHRRRVANEHADRGAVRNAGGDGDADHHHDGDAERNTTISNRHASGDCRADRITHDDGDAAGNFVAIGDPNAAGNRDGHANVDGHHDGCCDFHHDRDLDDDPAVNGDVGVADGDRDRGRNPAAAAHGRRQQPTGWVAIGSGARSHRVARSSRSSRGNAQRTLERQVGRG